MSEGEESDISRYLCLSPETSLEERSSATKRPAAEGDGWEEEEPKKKITFGLGKPQVKGSVGAPLTTKKPIAGISIKLGQTQQKPVSQAGALAVKPKVGSAAAVFGSEDDDEDEEMPPEARMRMKNIGRDTPTSAGPNSFGKTRMGFCDSKKIYEKQLKDVQDRSNKLEQDGV
ncbi:PEST proteolytic signal-containing nuclear protein isoform X3 [Procambarus clarkii]|uniref:PEST proteolytic signal-containing nuclear protein isoform X3 n=1 Tax=Procambarus clarkii TaxID=6728 RepID=UPI001E677B4E|nr:PEST proteolytic signal-containing nuclear protein-like isoform X1 [Procambarus clarkii]